MADSPATEASLPQIEANARSRGLPATWDWLKQGVGRQRDASLLALVAAWTGLPIALWLAPFGAAVGILAGVLGTSQIGLAHTIHVEEGVGVLGSIAGAIVGAFAGFYIIVGSYLDNPGRFFAAIFSGVLVGGLTLAVLVVFEPLLLSLRSYRRPSRREQVRMHPLLREAGRRMGLAVIPELRMSDSEEPGAWAHMRAIVVTRGLLERYDSSAPVAQPVPDDTTLGAVLAHELHHWHSGDAVGMAVVWSCFWPVAVLCNAATLLRRRAGWLGTLGWFLLWPTWVTTRFVVAPLMARQCRDYEYEADARAASLGDDYRLGLRRALEDVSEWEKPRSGWEDSLAATHPPTELRLERLESPRDAASSRPL
jgi:Zn-dependent protease with chaperone function